MDELSKKMEIKSIRNELKNLNVIYQGPPISELGLHLRETFKKQCVEKLIKKEQTKLKEILNKPQTSSPNIKIKIKDKNKQKNQEPPNNNCSLKEFLQKRIDIEKIKIKKDDKNLIGALNWTEILETVKKQNQEEMKDIVYKKEKQKNQLLKRDFLKTILTNRNYNKRIEVLKPLIKTNKRLPELGSYHLKYNFCDRHVPNVDIKNFSQRKENKWLIYMHMIHPSMTNLTAYNKIYDTNSKNRSKNFSSFNKSRFSRNSRNSNNNDLYNININDNINTNGNDNNGYLYKTGYLKSNKRDFMSTGNLLSPFKNKNNNKSNNNNSKTIIDSDNKKNKKNNELFFITDCNSERRTFNRTHKKIIKEKMNKLTGYNNKNKNNSTNNDKNNEKNEIKIEENYYINKNYEINKK